MNCGLKPHIIIIIQGTQLTTLSFRTTCIYIQFIQFVFLQKNIGLLQFHCNSFKISIMHRRCVLIFSWVIQQKNDARHDINLLFKKKQNNYDCDRRLLITVCIHCRFSHA